jgi:hypothetical protein
MSPEPIVRLALWGTVSSGCRQIEIGWDRLESVGQRCSICCPTVHTGVLTAVPTTIELSFCLRRLTGTGRCLRGFAASSMVEPDLNRGRAADVVGPSPQVGADRLVEEDGAARG